jgi:transcriptional regulator with XRE-family HTH domain
MRIPDAELRMLGEKLKRLREAKSWGQAHLADAAALNVRTVQRIEAGEPASYETLLSLAAALNVDVAELEPEARRPASNGTSRSRLAVALLLVSPASSFIAVNLLRSLAGISGPFDALAEAGGKVMGFGVFNRVSPFIFLGGPAIALILCLPTLVRVRTTRAARGVLSVNGLELRAERAALTVAALAILSATVLVGYAALELLHMPAS